MTEEHSALALRHAPVLHQKVSPLNPRGDLVTRIDLTGSLEGLVGNWAFVSDASNELPGAGYYSVAETATHYFILYAFYHSQDWYDGDMLFDRIRKMFDEHRHDMEGALAVVTKRADRSRERVDAFITISHIQFYCYAGWRKSGTELLYPDDRWENSISGRLERLDGGIWPAADGGMNRFSLFSQATGHGIKGDRKGWGEEKRVIRYRPSLETAAMPRLDDGAFREERGYLFQEAGYRLIDIHEPGGLWANRDNPMVFLENEKGQPAFATLSDDGVRIAGMANPPWSWEDFDDRHDCGMIATDPARFVYDYLDGFPEFSLEYTFNPYLGIGV